jgi:hypothetical protein
MDERTWLEPGSEPAFLRLERKNEENFLVLPYALRNHDILTTAGPELCAGNLGASF